VPGQDSCTKSHRRLSRRQLSPWNKEQTYDSPWRPYTTIPDEYNEENKRSSHALKTASEYAKLVRIVHKKILLRWLLPSSWDPSLRPNHRNDYHILPTAPHSDWPDTNLRGLAATLMILYSRRWNFVALLTCRSFFHPLQSPDA